MDTPALHPSKSMGWTHSWDGTTQLALSDEEAAALVYLGIARYTGDYRVYRPTGTWTNEEVVGILGRDNVTTPERER